MSNPVTRVIFRADKRGDFKGSITAVFPDEAEGCGAFMSYAHVGQHSLCHRDWYVTETRAATPEEYAHLKAELESYGPPEAHYNLKILKRWPH